MTGRSAFSDEEIRQLVRGPTDEDRAVVAHRLCRRIDAQLSDEERAAAAEVLRLMAADAAELVRRALAVTLRRSPHLPRDVALKLAADLDSILQFGLDGRLRNRSRWLSTGSSAVHVDWSCLSLAAKADRTGMEKPERLNHRNFHEPLSLEVTSSPIGYLLKRYLIRRECLYSGD